MRDNSILRVVGLGSSLPLDAADPLNPMNRRISLVVLNEKTQRQSRGLPEESMEEVQKAAEAAAALGLGGEGAPAPVDGAAPSEPATGPPAPGQQLAQPAGRGPA